MIVLHFILLNLFLSTKSSRYIDYRVYVDKLAGCQILFSFQVFSRSILVFCFNILCFSYEQILLLVTFFTFYFVGHPFTKIEKSSCNYYKKLLTWYREFTIIKYILKCYFALLISTIILQLNDCKCFFTYNVKSILMCTFCIPSKFKTLFK